MPDLPCYLLFSVNIKHEVKREKRKGNYYLMF